ncbi:5-dehydro-4-deoxy-D-glucuronate isomerase [Pedobacter cryoconitis]|uniref:5-dehydro-4-deoxy-D-glucuronate isomerase n=1 Tax=Pedobacter cryoconitis TaxID=188932 RepID=UPI0017EC0637|nr:5-dehydro-4-deoxy-D-glucuronate isomerase [Pedobacter cryoconitis]MBB5644101.1 4-deoxy-L-threo-5-hexosulose-uronate ketol-isomerase [Pedobacter cryoconitis]
MKDMKVLHAVHPDDFKTYDTEKIRSRFLLTDLKEENKANFAYTHYDRMIVGLVHPVAETVVLGNYSNLRADYFLERREIGIINVGGPGSIEADGKTFEVNKLDALYLGKGVKEVKFKSEDAANPAVFYCLSTPAHQAYPVTLLVHADAVSTELGSLNTANERRIIKYIHRDGIQSSQLVMGLTILANGSVWNTMPAHTHDRRMEAYFYFDVAADQRVFHLMGQPQETRHVLMGNHDAIVSPPWSIHSGSGTQNYSFIWGMGGENLDYADMDPVAIQDIR